MLNIFGAYIGRDVSALTVSQYTEESVMTDLRRFANAFNGLVQDLIQSRISDRTEKVKGKYGGMAGGEMQPAAELGEQEATRGAVEWDYGYPIYRYRDRQLYTPEYLATVKLEQLEKDVINASVRYYETFRKNILRAEMLKTNFNFDDGASEADFPKLGQGTIPVKRYLNNDSADGELWVDGTKVAIGSLQHYFGTNTASMTVAGFKTAYAKLKTIGHTGDVVARISSTDEDTVRGFTEFVPGNNTKIVDPTKKYATLTDSRAIGRLEGTGISSEVIVEPFMPAAYVKMEDRSRPPGVALRHHPLAQFRGFNLVQDQTRSDYGDVSMRNKRWETIQGLAVKNRPNGVVFQVVNSTTTYTDPTI
jgi:hypothetical protein